MKYSLVLLALFSASTIIAADVAATDTQATTQATQSTKVAETKVTVMCPANECKKVNALEDKIVSLESRLGQVTQKAQEQEKVLEKNKKMLISVVGQGVAPMNTSSPAQAYALAKRAAVADAYRLVAEKVKGVRVEGQDVIKNMMVKRSTVRTSVSAMVKMLTLLKLHLKRVYAK